MGGMNDQESTQMMASVVYVRPAQDIAIRDKYTYPQKIEVGLANVNLVQILIAKAEKMVETAELTFPDDEDKKSQYIRIVVRPEQRDRFKELNLSSKILRQKGWVTKIRYRDDNRGLQLEKKNPKSSDTASWMIHHEDYISKEWEDP